MIFFDVLFTITSNINFYLVNISYIQVSKVVNLLPETANKIKCVK